MLMPRLLPITAMVLLSLPIIIQIELVYYLQKFCHFILPSGVHENDHFDFIVVGAGSAGSAVTGRLVEKGYQVLLVEAGGPPHYLQSIPGFAATFMTGTDKYTWQYTTTPQKHACKAYKNRQLNIRHGKSLGGTSMVNFMMYVRGNTKDYDGWEAMGNPGWGWKDVLPFFKRAEKIDIQSFENTPDACPIDAEHHGTEGRLHVMPGGEPTQAALIADNAMEEMGYRTGDYNGKLQDEAVAFNSQMSQKFGFRADSFTSFIRDPGLHLRGNLKILSFAHVTRLVVENGHVTGVEVNRFGKTSIFNAQKEVVLSSGAIGSPKILLQSGIGPKEHLTNVGVDIKKNLPGVGLNLHDHVVGHYTYISRNSTGLMTNIFKSLNPIKLMKFLMTGNGAPFGDSGVSRGMFFKSGHQKQIDQLDRPDMQMVTYTLAHNVDYGTAVFNQLFGLEDDQYPAMYLDENNFEQYDTILLAPKLLRPKSRGTIQLASNDPFDIPLIDPNYLDDQDDVDTLVAGMQVASQFAKTKAFKKHQLEHLQDKKNCPDLEVDSKEYLQCLLRAHASTTWHLGGSCKMGSNSDPMAVVDSNLKVHGVSGVRVADASIMPTVVAGNPNAATIMIGEKAADLISKDWPVTHVNKGDAERSKNEL